jgi:hypothetical protein
LLEVFLNTIQFHRGLKRAIRKVRNAIPVAAHPNKFFNVIIPGGNVFVADRPVNAVTIIQVCFKVEIAPA